MPRSMTVNKNTPALRQIKFGIIYVSHNSRLFSIPQTTERTGITVKTAAPCRGHRNGISRGYAAAAATLSPGFLQTAGCARMLCNSDSADFPDDVI